MLALVTSVKQRRRIFLGEFKLQLLPVLETSVLCRLLNFMSSDLLLTLWCSSHCYACVVPRCCPITVLLWLQVHGSSITASSTRTQGIG